MSPSLDQKELMDSHLMDKTSHHLTRQSEATEVLILTSPPKHLSLLISPSQISAILLYPG